MREALESQICAIAYADVVSSTSITPEVQKAVLNKLIRDIVSEAKNSYSVVHGKSMGDGFLVCGSDAYEMSEFALNVRDRFKNANWERLGLPNGLAIRIGMELGTVRLVADDEGEIDVSGSSIEKAARIEKITPPNTIWITDHFANHLQREAVPNLALNSIGKKTLPKKAGEMPLFELRWQADGSSAESKTETDTATQPVGHIPKVRRKFTDVERDKFILSAFKIIQNFFERSLQQLKDTQPHLVEVSLETVTTRKFTAEVHVNGERRSSCKIWAGGKSMFGGRNREIAYSTNYFSVDDDSSMNESFSISDDGYDLFLESIGMIYWDDENKFTPEQAADHLWKNFIQGIE